MGLAPEPGAARREEASKVTVTVTAAGVPYTFRPAEISASLAGEFRRVSGGMTVRQLMGMSSDDADLDVMGGLIWLARRQAGDDIAYADVLDAINYGTEFDVSDAEADAAPEDADSPEASGGS